MSGDEARRRVALQRTASVETEGLTLDKGIARAVEVLREHGIETYQSCEGGEGHAYPEPTIEFYGRDGAGWQALSVCLTYGFPVSELRRTRPMLDGVSDWSLLGLDLQAAGRRRSARCPSVIRPTAGSPAASSAAHGATTRLPHRAVRGRWGSKIDRDATPR